MTKVEYLVKPYEKAEKGIKVTTLKEARDKAKEIGGCYQTIYTPVKNVKWEF